MEREELLQQHKKENKDLIATITGLKKQATKKTRKNVLSKCQELEDNLKRKHAEELAALDNGGEGNNKQVEQEITPEQLLEQLTLEKETSQLSLSQLQSQLPSQLQSQPQSLLSLILSVSSNDQQDSNKQSQLTGQQNSSATPSGSQPRRRNRQKERLEKRKAEIERMKTEAQQEASNMTDYRQIEIDSMNQLLDLHGLELYEIKPDGHCLFAAIQDQLYQRHDHLQKTIQELRDLAADYILAHKDDFIPYLFDEKTCEIRDVDEYCHELRTTAMWGSDLEILALAKIFNCCISIHMAGASTIKINENKELNLDLDQEHEHDQEPELMLGYYKHSYGLGEHYNSLRDKK